MCALCRIRKECPVMHDAYPDYEYKRITDITLDDLYNMGAKAVAVDLDNTTVLDSTLHAPGGVKEWLGMVRGAGFPVIIITNTYPIRAWMLSRKFGKLPWISFAEKPNTGAFFKAAKMLQVNVEDIVMIGDRLFKDVMGANKAGCISVKVDPFEPEKLFAKKLRRERKKEDEYLAKRRKERNAENRRFSRKTEKNK